MAAKSQIPKIKIENENGEVVGEINILAKPPLMIGDKTIIDEFISLLPKIQELK